MVWHHCHPAPPPALPQLFHPPQADPTRQWGPEMWWDVDAARAPPRDRLCLTAQGWIKPATPLVHEQTPFGARSTSQQAQRQTRGHVRRPQAPPARLTVQVAAAMQGMMINKRRASRLHGHHYIRGQSMCITNGWNHREHTHTQHLCDHKQDSTTQQLHFILCQPPTP